MSTDFDVASALAGARPSPGEGNPDSRESVSSNALVLPKPRHRPSPEVPLRRRGIGALAVATMIGSAGLSAGGIAGALLGAEFAGPRATGLPPGFLVIGSALAALPIARRASQVGRARSLVLGYVAGALGAVLVIVAAIMGSLVVLLAGSIMLGAGNASIFLTRYAAAEIGGETARGRALGIVFFATAIGAIASPNLMGPSGQIAQALGLPRLAGLYLVAVVAFATAAMILTVLSTRVEHPLSLHHGAGNARGDIVAALKTWPARIALAVLASANLIMVGVMTVAPLHLTSHGEGPAVIGVAVSFHVAGMFLPAPFSGWLADRAGPMIAAALGIALLVTAGIVGALIPDHDTASLVMVLTLLGIGWNCAVVGASTHLAASVLPVARPHVESIGEVAMGLAAAVGAPVAGVVVATGSLATLWLLAATLAGSVLILVRSPLRHAAPSFVASSPGRTR